MARNVLIDIDNTLTNLSYTLREIESYFGCSRKEINEITDFNLASVYGIPKHKHRSFWLERELDIVRNSQLNQNIYNVIQKEIRHSDTIYIVSARDNQLLEATKEWLKKHNVRFDYLACIGKEKSKLDWLEENGIEIDIVFEDEPSFVDSLDDGVDKNIIDYPYNRHVKADRRLYPLANEA